MSQDTRTDSLIPVAPLRGQHSLVVFLLCTLTCLVVSITSKAADPHPGKLMPEYGPYGTRVEYSNFIPMRDGVRLSTDFYLPDGYDGTMATVLLRTPYDKDRDDPFRNDDGGGVPGKIIKLFTSHGFAVLVQDVRGKFESEGEYFLNKNYRVDGYDTIEWIARQAWSNGKVGSYGCSYLGENQLYMAPSQPPSLAAMIPQAAGSAIGQAGGFYFYANGFNTGTVRLTPTQWYYYNLPKIYYRPPAGLNREEFLAIRRYYEPGPHLPDVDWRALWRTLPVIDMLDRIGAVRNEWRDFITHEADVTDPWWDQFDYVRDDEPISVPALYIETWGDLTVGATLYMREMHSRTAVNAIARKNQKIIIAPGNHCSSESHPANLKMGELELGDPSFGHLSLYLDWYRQWLRGEERGVEDWPTVQYYMIGRNEWRASEQWPPESVTLVPFYFQSEGDANSHFGDGRLSLNLPDTETPDQYTYDPANPVPSAGGAYSVGQEGTDYVDQRPVSSRNDVLVFTSDVLLDGMEIAGPIDVVLYVSSSARDTDFMVKLVDVASDGMAVNVQLGDFRARYREGREKEVLMQEGKTYRVPVSLNNIAWWFRPGHRIRVQVTSSDFPSIARNLNTGGNNYDETEWVTAHNTVHHSRESASLVLLPVVGSSD